MNSNMGNGPKPSALSYFRVCSTRWPAMGINRAARWWRTSQPFWALPALFLVRAICRTALLAAVCVARQHYLVSRERLLPCRLFADDAHGRAGRVRSHRRRHYRNQLYRHLCPALLWEVVEAALTHARRALSFREAGGFRPYQPLDHLALWDIYQKKGDTANAQFHMQQASALAEEMGFSTLVSSMIDTTNRLGAQKEEA